MRKLFALFLISLATQSFAYSDVGAVSEVSPQLKSLGTAFETSKPADTNLNDDINIVYGGEDMSAQSMSPLLLA